MSLVPWRQPTAKLPEILLDKEDLEHMKVGETAYTTPWAMWVDADMNCWLHPHYPAGSNPRGTVRMRVTLRRGGYHVWPARDERYRPSDSQPYVGGEDVQWLPVAALHGVAT